MANANAQKPGVSSHGLDFQYQASPSRSTSALQGPAQHGYTSAQPSRQRATGIYELSEVAAPAPVDRRPVRDTLEQREYQNVPSSSIADEEQHDLSEVAAPAPADRRPKRYTLEQAEYEDASSSTDEEQYDLSEAAAPAPVADRRPRPPDTTLEAQQQEQPNGPSTSRPAQAPKSSPILTQIYIISHLILFSILGTLARLGVQWLTFYPGAPVVFSNIWANFGGTLVMGFFTEDRRIFLDEWGEQQARSHEGLKGDADSLDSRGSPSTRAKHLKVKKTIPLYIGITTGFCGSFTSFSTFMRDTFLALANKRPTPISHPTTTAPLSSTVARNGGYSFQAILAVIILTVTASVGALKLGAHLAIGVDRVTPTLPFKVIRRVIDPLVVFLGFGCWIGAVIMSAVPPDRPGGPASNGSWDREVWRGQVLFGLIFAPLGCLLRFYLSAKMNAMIEGFPLGTFAANIFGTAVFGMAYDLQRAPLLVGGAALAGGGRVGCQILQGIEDGFCGCLTTVSTWALELTTLRRKHAYIYGSFSVLIGLALLVVIMGSVSWSIGFLTPVCAVETS